MMSSRKLKLESIDRADTKGQQWVLQFSRPITFLEAEGVANIINQAIQVKHG